MNSENLINLEKVGKIEKENFTLENITRRYIIVLKRVKNAELLLEKSSINESVYISAYAELYSSFRGLCDIMLAVSGYRARKGLGHHETVISTIWLTLEDDELNSTYLRLKKIGGKRNKLEYGGTFDISSSEMKTMLGDVKLILKRVGDEIRTKKKIKTLFWML